MSTDVARPRVATVPAVIFCAGLLLLLAGGWWWMQSGPGTADGMAAGQVVQRSASGQDLDLTVAYEVDGARLETEGTVSRAAFDFQGGAVWVCYDPTDPKDARLRLPMDPWCAQPDQE